MPPLYRIDIGKEVFYALDDKEKQGVLDRIAAEKLKGKFSVQRFKGLGEMNPLQLRETTMPPETRGLVQLTLAQDDRSDELMDMPLGEKRAADRRGWSRRAIWRRFESASAVGSGLHYDPASDTYTSVWKTSKEKSTCQAQAHRRHQPHRVVQVQLGGAAWDDPHPAFPSSQGGGQLA